MIPWNQEEIHGACSLLFTCFSKQKFFFNQSLSLAPCWAHDAASVPIISETNLFPCSKVTSSKHSWGVAKGHISVWLPTGNFGLWTQVLCLSFSNDLLMEDWPAELNYIPCLLSRRLGSKSSWALWKRIPSEWILAYLCLFAVMRCPFSPKGIPQSLTWAANSVQQGISETKQCSWPDQCTCFEVCVVFYFWCQICWLLEGGGLLYSRQQVELWELNS